MGAHGGGGTSALCALLRRLAGGGGDGEVHVGDLSSCPDGDPGQIAPRSRLKLYAGRPLIIAARGTGEGTRRAVIAVTVTEILGLCPPVLAVVADGAGPLPAAAAQRLAQLNAEQRVAAVVHIPFSTAIRAGIDPAAARLPARLRRAVGHLAAAVRDPRDGGAE
jgi:hypothetical protein